MFSSPCTSSSNQQHSDKIAFMRLQSQMKLKSSWEQLIEKYAHDFNNSDIIDIQTGKIVVDKGHLRSTDIPQFGDDESQSNSGSESESESDTDILDTLLNPESKHVSKSSLLRKELIRHEKINHSPASTVKWDSDEDEPDFKQLAKLRARRIAFIKKTRVESESNDVEETSETSSNTDDEIISDDCSVTIGMINTPSKQYPTKLKDHGLDLSSERNSDCVKGMLNNPLKGKSKQGHPNTNQCNTQKSLKKSNYTGKEGRQATHTPETRNIAPIKHRLNSNESPFTSKFNNSRPKHVSNTNQQLKSDQNRNQHQQQSHTQRRNPLSNFMHSNQSLNPYIPSPTKYINERHKSREHLDQQQRNSSKVEQFDNFPPQIITQPRAQIQSDGFSFKRKRDLHQNFDQQDDEYEQDYYHHNQQQLTRRNNNQELQMYGKRPINNTSNQELQMYDRFQTNTNTSNNLFHEIVYVETDQDTAFVLNDRYGREKGYREYTDDHSDMYHSDMYRNQIEYSEMRSDRYDNAFSRACLEEGRDTVPYIEEIYYTPVKKIDYASQRSYSSTGKVNRTRVDDKRNFESRVMKRTLFECRQ